MRLRILAILVAHGTWASPAIAEVTGNDLKSYCVAPPRTPAQTMCIGYISGALDAYRAVNHMQKKKLFCEARGVTGEQIVSMMNKYFEENPEQLHFVASQLVLIVMAASFPCEK